jgi:GT2 family glycosyltransferase
MAHAEPPQGRNVNPAVLVVNWNSSEEALRLIGEVNAAVIGGFGCVGILVIDNHSANADYMRLCEGLPVAAAFGPNVDADAGVDGIERTLRIKSLACEVVIARAKENSGFTGGCNRGIELIRILWGAANVVILNPDIRVGGAALEALVAALRMDQMAVVGGRVQSLLVGREDFVGSTLWGELLWSGAGRRRMRARARNGADIVDVDMVAGSAMALSRAFVESIRTERGFVFDENLFLYGEELELCQWARRHGWRVASASRARFAHGMELIAAGPGGVLNGYYCSRNLLWIGREYSGPRLRLVFEGLFPLTRLAHAVRHAMMCRPKLAAAMLIGLRDGYLGLGGKWAWHVALERERSAAGERA